MYIPNVLNINQASGVIRTRDLVLTRHKELEEAQDPKESEVTLIITSFLSSSKHDEFLKYLIDKGVNPKLARRYVIWAIDYAKYVSINGYDTARYLSRFTNLNTYNNKLKPIIHLHRFLGLPYPNVKFKAVSKDRLIKAPSYEEVLAGFSEIKDENLTMFYLFCCTTLLRPQFTITLTYENIDIKNRIIDVRVHRKTKHYRPQIIHRVLLEYLQQQDSKESKLFPHCYDYYGKKIKRLTGITPSQLRDFAYNAMLKSGMNPLIVEWLMGHDIGISKHYLADDIKYEYTKFERMYTFYIS